MSLEDLAVVVMYLHTKFHPAVHNRSGDICRTDRQTHRQKDRQTHGRTDRHRDRDIEAKTEAETAKVMSDVP